ncbi:hypothetical protein LOD99_8764 [Oopsacas minuta]|uniref:MULE transposase domain-containing protein n=1 Tax=Oopsacas minuta TaxID=111878 RepID=A0AAV7JGA7_9METZ|nr:hypothetical protein LOD99_8764 [Oopsacas minuta]
MRMWEQIRLLCRLAQPQQILLDFEKGAINSFEHVWPITEVKCCFLHLTQNIWGMCSLVTQMTKSWSWASGIYHPLHSPTSRHIDFSELFELVSMDFPPTIEIVDLLD